VPPRFQPQVRDAAVLRASRRCGQRCCQAQRVRGMTGRWRRRWRWQTEETTSCCVVQHRRIERRTHGDAGTGSLHRRRVQSKSRQIRRHPARLQRRRWATWRQHHAPSNACEQDFTDNCPSNRSRRNATLAEFTRDENH